MILRYSLINIFQNKSNISTIFNSTKSSTLLKGRFKLICFHNRYVVDCSRLHTFTESFETRSVKRS